MHGPSPVNRECALHGFHPCEGAAAGERRRVYVPRVPRAELNFRQRAATPSQSSRLRQAGLTDTEIGQARAKVGPLMLAYNLPYWI